MLISILSKKSRGNNSQMASLRQVIQESSLTKCICLRIVNSMYDPLGLESPLTLKLIRKIRDQFASNNNLRWDTLLSEGEADGWIRLFEELLQLDRLEFPRCVRSLGSCSRAVTVCFVDASSEAFGCVGYCRWNMLSVNFVCTFTVIFCLFRCNCTIYLFAHSQ